MAEPISKPEATRDVQQIAEEFRNALWAACARVRQYTEKGSDTAAQRYADIVQKLLDNPHARFLLEKKQKGE